MHGVRQDELWSESNQSRRRRLDVEKFPTPAASAMLCVFLFPKSASRNLMPPESRGAATGRRRAASGLFLGSSDNNSPTTPAMRCNGSPGTTSTRPPSQGAAARRRKPPRHPPNPHHHPATPWPPWHLKQPVPLCRPRAAGIRRLAGGQQAAAPLAQVTARLAHDAKGTALAERLHARRLDDAQLAWCTTAHAGADAVLHTCSTPRPPPGHCARLSACTKHLKWGCLRLQRTARQPRFVGAAPQLACVTDAMLTVSGRAGSGAPRTCTVRSA